jgi:hypothetical protein
MARTRTAPWDYRQAPPTLAQLQADNIYIQYCMILNRLERDYGIDYVAEIVKSWGDISYSEKLEKVQLLEVEMDAEYIARAGLAMPLQS